MTDAAVAPHPPSAVEDAAALTLATTLAAALLPVFQAALPSTAAMDADHVTAHALLDMGRAVREGSAPAPQLVPPPPTLPARVDAPTGEAEFMVKRRITCVTYLRRLHVTSDMVGKRGGGREKKRGGAKIVFNTPPFSRLQAAKLLPDMKTHVPLHAMRNMPNSRFFKRGLAIVDPYGRPHEVRREREAEKKGRLIAFSLSQLRVAHAAPLAS